MIDQRKVAFDNISRALAITRYDIEQHQFINDQSLNIHGENWFRDVFNYVYNLKLRNANFQSSNSPAIDLVDDTNKLAYQITTTRKKEKAENTLKKIKTTDYKDYKLKIFFLLQKSNFNKETVDYFKDNYNVDIEDYLIDYTNLVKDIEALETDKLIELNKKFFTVIANKYTNEIVLDLIIKHLLKKKKNVKKDYDDDFGTIGTNEKLKLNGINQRLTSEINKGLDYRSIIENYVTDTNLLTDLRSYIIDMLYRNILLDVLKVKILQKDLSDKKTFELQDIACRNKVDFNKLINKLHQEIENNIEVNDFNSMDIAWIIIAFFFELSDVGVDKPC